MLGEDFCTSTYIRTTFDNNSTFKRDEFVYKPALVAVGFIPKQELLDDEGEVGKWFSENGIDKDECFNTLHNLIDGGGIRTEEEGSILLRRNKGILRFGVNREVSLNGKTGIVFSPIGGADNVASIMHQLSVASRKWIFEGGASQMGSHVLGEDRTLSTRVDCTSVLRLGMYEKVEWEKRVDEEISLIDTISADLGADKFGILCVFGSIFGITPSIAALMLKNGTWKAMLKTRTY